MSERVELAGGLTAQYNPLHHRKDAPSILPTAQERLNARAVEFVGKGRAAGFSDEEIQHYLDIAIAEEFGGTK